MSRRIVFAGGAQTRALARVYRAEVATQTGDDVIFIGTGAVGTDAARSTLLMADLVAMEIDEDGDAIPADSLPQAALVRVPNLYCDYLWPFAGRAHPRNRGAFALPGGPYPAEHGDRYLDQMAADGVNETTAIVRYKAMDIAREGELDSRLAERSAIQADLDAKAGFDLAPFIADRFRAEPLFRTRQRLTMKLLARLVDQLFTKLGVQGWREDSLRRVPFPAGAQPLHPGVIAHFGLAWATPHDRYPVNDEGSFTFEAFCRRYMGFVWNETLHRGIQTAKTSPAAAIADLQAGLAESPDSPLGRIALVVAQHAADPALGPADPALVVDEESYDPIAPVARDEVPDEPAVVAAADVEPAAAEAAAVKDEGGEHPAAETVLSENAEAAFATEDTEDTAAQAPLAQAAPEPEADLLDAEAPGLSSEGPPEAARVEDAPPDDAPIDEEDALIGGAAPAPVLVKPPSRPRSREENDAPARGSVADGFTDFSPVPAPQPAMAAARDDLIDALPSLLPVFADLASTSDRPFGAMPEVMPPPPLRPILPPELQEDGPKPGLLARMLGRK